MGSLRGVRVVYAPLRNKIKTNKAEYFHFSPAIPAGVVGGGVVVVVVSHSFCGVGGGVFVAHSSIPDIFEPWCGVYDGITYEC